MLKKLKKFIKVVYCFCTDSDNLVLYLVRLKALESLKRCYELHVKNTEELEDLLFHIKTYFELPKALVEINYKEFKNVNINKMIKKLKKDKLEKSVALRFTNFLADLEKQRAIERSFILEDMKILDFGFEY